VRGRAKGGTGARGGQRAAGAAWGGWGKGGALTPVLLGPLARPLGLPVPVLVAVLLQGGRVSGFQVFRVTVVSDCLRFLLIILGRNGSGNDSFWLKTDRLKNYFRPKEAQTGLKLDKPEKNVAKTNFFNIVFGRNGSIKKIISPAETKAIRHYGIVKPSKP
jgi:hypothetical protein